YFRQFGQHLPDETISSDENLPDISSFYFKFFSKVRKNPDFRETFKVFSKNSINTEKAIFLSRIGIVKDNIDFLLANFCFELCRKSHFCLKSRNLLVVVAYKQKCLFFGVFLSIILRSEKSRK